MSIRITVSTDLEASDSARRLVFLAHDDDGSPLGTASLRMFAREGQRHLAELELNVHPAERRRGVGSRLLDAAVGTAREETRRAVIAQTKAESAGNSSCRRRDFANYWP